MKVITRRFEVDGRRGEWRLDVYGDTHLATKAVTEDKLKEDIADTLKRGRHWVHLGDVIDGIVPGDRRWNDFYKKILCPWAWDAYQNNKIIEAEWKYFGKLFTPIASKGLVVLSGDGKHNKMSDISDCFYTEIAKMGIPGGFPACFLKLIFTRTKAASSRKTVYLMLHHGYFGGRTTSNKVIQLEKALNNFPQVSAFLCGHGHDKVSMRINSLIVERDRTTERIRRGAMTGSYLRTYADGIVNYGEIKGYPPVAIGKITLVLRPFSSELEKRVEFENM